MRTRQPGPLFRFHLSGKKNPVEKNDTCWKAPLPLDRRHTISIDDSACITYGDYFEGVRSFLEKNDFRAVTTAVSQSSSASILSKNIESIHVHLEKHGPFYHPSRVEVKTDQTIRQYVLNVAVSSAGKNTIYREYRLIERLNEHYTYGFLPMVYYQDEVIGRNDVDMVMFLGEWIDDYHEFHISEISDEGCRIMIWDPSLGKTALAPDMVTTLYRETAKILTCYYNPETFEQIFPWYHAAGDFIVNLKDTSLNLKLITVRQYGPMMVNEGIDLRDILEAMLVFLINISIWTRIDRIDGVSDLVWTDDRAIEGTLSGFYKGLELKGTTEPLAEPLTVFFREYVSALSESDLHDMSLAIVDTYPSRAPELSLIRRYLDDHVHRLNVALKNHKT